MSGGGAGSGGSGPDRPSGGNRGQGGYPPQGGGRAPRQQPPPPQNDRPISFQAEDRYWTDYLRVILPVVGLLLLLGLFWFWASSLIGDDGGAPATPSQQAIILTPDAPTATATTETEISPQETTETDEGDGEGEEPAEPTATTEEEEEEPETVDGEYQVDDFVAVTDSVNLRSDPTNEEENVITTLEAGTELRIVGGPEEANGFTWWEVSNDETGDEGWVAGDFIEPST